MESPITNIIDDIIRREGFDAETAIKADRGGRTKFGIAEKANPVAWADGDVSLDEARDIYMRKYVKGPGFDQVADPMLMAQLVDFGVNSGPAIAIQKLQTILKVDVDGVLGPDTLRALALRDVREVNNLLVGERVKMIGRLCLKDRSQLAFLNGWLNRATEFLF